MSCFPNYSYKIVCLSIVFLSLFGGLFGCSRRGGGETSGDIVIVGDQTNDETIPPELIEEIAVLINDGEMEFYRMISQPNPDADSIAARLKDMTAVMKKRTGVLENATPDQMNRLRSYINAGEGISPEEIDSASRRLIEMYGKNKKFKKAYDAYRGVLNRIEG